MKRAKFVKTHIAPILIALLAAHTGSADDAITPADVKGPTAWGKVENVTSLRHLYFSGQPDPTALERARSEGVVAVIDLRSPSEFDWDEKTAVERLGMAYHNVPVSGKRFDRAAMQSIESLVAAQSDQPVLIHCSSSNRAAGWLATHLVGEHAMSVDDALAVGRRAGITKDVIEKSVRRYVEEEAAVRRAQDALLPFKKNLKQALTSAMQKEGPLGAVDACRIEAPRLTAASNQPGIAIGRTSHKLRNPNNAPEEWMKQLLEALRKSSTTPAAPRVARIGPGRLGYAEPIYMQPLCLTCHGTDISPALLEHLAERYPKDRATDFELNELRGIFWVEVALPDAS